MPIKPIEWHCGHRRLLVCHICMCPSLKCVPASVWGPRCLEIYWLHLPKRGVHLSDLTFIEDGNKDLVGGLINFTKRRLLYRVIADLRSYQQNAYNLVHVPQITALLDTLPLVDDDRLYEISQELEPRNAERKDILWGVKLYPLSVSLIHMCVVSFYLYYYYTVTKNKEKNP